MSIYMLNISVEWARSEVSFVTDIKTSLKHPFCVKYNRKCK